MHLSSRSSTPEHQRPLPHVGFWLKRRCHPPHSVSSTVSCISSLIGPLLTLFPLPPSWQILPRPPESTTGPLPPPELGSATSSMTHRHSASTSPPPCPTAAPYDAGALGADLITPKPRGDLPVGVLVLRCCHGPARPAMPLDQAKPRGRGPNSSTTLCAGSFFYFRLDLNPMIQPNFKYS
jgi:hypothetical protein